MRHFTHSSSRRTSSAATHHRCESQSECRHCQGSPLRASPIPSRTAGGTAWTKNHFEPKRGSWSCPSESQAGDKQRPHLPASSFDAHTHAEQKQNVNTGAKKIIQQNWLISHVFKLLPITPGSASGKVEVVMWLELVLLGVIALSPTTKRNLFWPTV